MRRGIVITSQLGYFMRKNLASWLFTISVEIVIQQCQCQYCNCDRISAIYFNPDLSYFMRKNLAFWLFTISVEIMIQKCQHQYCNSDTISAIYFNPKLGYFMRKNPAFWLVILGHGHFGDKQYWCQVERFRLLCFQPP